MPRARKVVVLVAVGLGTTLWTVAAGRRRNPQPPCPPASYVLAPPPAIGEDATSTTLVMQAGATAIAIDGLCEPIAPKRYRGTRKGITRVRAKWPACAGFEGKVKLSGKIVDGCETFRGRVRARRFRRRVAGARDGVTGLVGAAGGRVASADGRLTLDVPAGALPGDTAISIRRLGPGEIPPEVAAEGFTPVYALGPAGLQFAAPVTVTFLAEGSPVGPNRGFETGVGVLVTLSRDGETLEPLADQRTVVDAANGVVTVSGMLTHFTFTFNAASTGASATGRQNAFVQGTLDPGLVVPVGGLLSSNVVLTIGRDVVDASGTAVHVNMSDDSEDEDSAVVEYDPFGPKEDVQELGPVAAAGDVAQGTIFYRCLAPGQWNYAAEIQVRRGNTLLDLLGKDVLTELTVVIQPQTITCVVTTTSTSVTSTTASTSTTTTSTSTTSSTSSTSTSTSSTTSTSLMPCQLVQPDPDPVTNPFPDPVCNGFCPVDQLCVFSPDDDGCTCKPADDRCRDVDPDPQNATCNAGLCENPDASCVFQQDTGGGSSGCICQDPCFARFNPPSEDDPDGSFECVVAGVCPDGKVCDLTLCRCVPPPTTTSTSATSTTTSTASSTSTTSTSTSSTTSSTTSTTSTSTPPTTTSSTTSTTTSTSTTSTSLPDLGECRLGSDASGPVCLGACESPSDRCLFDPESGNCACVDQGLVCVPDEPDGGCSLGLLCERPGERCVEDDLLECDCKVVPTTVTTTSTSPSTTSSSSSSTTTSTSTSSTTSTMPGGDCACDPACPTGQTCLAVHPPTGPPSCTCLPAEAECSQTAVPLCQSGLCSDPNERCVQDGSTCGCQVVVECGGPPDTTQDPVVCVGECEGSGFCLYDEAGGGCTCATTNQLCQPQGGDVCSGLCQGPEHECTCVDTRFGQGARCDHPRDFRAELTGDQEVPPVATTLSGDCLFFLKADGTGLEYDCFYSIGPSQFVAAHLHQGAVGLAGEDGPIQVDLGLDQGGFVAGTVDTGSVDGLVDALIDGLLYVHVHSLAHPDGAIRGQIGP